MEPQTDRPNHCEICDAPLFSKTETRCQRCLNPPKIAKPAGMPDRSPIMAKPDTRYAIPDARPEYDGVPDEDLPSYVPDPDHRGFTAVGRNGGNNPSTPAYKIWAKVVIAWGIVSAIVTALCLWKGHYVPECILLIGGAVILGFCSPNRYLQESFLPEEWFTHRMSRVLIIALAVGLPAALIGWLAAWILGKIA